MKLLQFVVLCILTVSCSVIALFLFLLWSRTPASPTLPASMTGYTIEALAVNITILEIVIGLVGFVVAVMGFFGYTGIKSAAVEIAEKEARRVADEQMRKFQKQQAPSSVGQTEGPGDFAPEDVPIEDAEEAEEE